MNNAEKNTQIKKINDMGKLVSPFGCVITTVAYLRMDDAMTGTEKPRLSEEKYQKFLAGEAITVKLTDSEYDGVREIIIKYDRGLCICNRDNLTEEEYYDSSAQLVPGKIGNGYRPRNWTNVPYNFLDKEPDKADQFRIYLEEVWSDLYDIKPEDSDFIKCLHDLDDIARGKIPPRPQSQSQSQSQQPTSVPATVQTDANGATVIGDCYRYNALRLKTALEQNKSNTGLTDANDSIMETIAKNLMQASGIYLGVYGQENSEPARQRKAAQLIGFEREQIDTLFGKRPKDISGKDDSDKDKEGAAGKSDPKDAEPKEDDALTKVERFNYEVGFGDEPAITDGPEVKLSKVRGAIKAVKASILEPDNSLERMYKLATAWAVLDEVIGDATERGIDAVGKVGLHYRLSKADVFKLMIENAKGEFKICDKKYTKLWFGEIETDSQS